MQQFSLLSFFLLLLDVPPDVVAYEGPLPLLPMRQHDVNRRSLLATSVAVAVGASSLSITTPVWAASDQTNGIAIKVTPMAHTFITSSGTAAKPIRENDATRFFTNAKVVYLLQGKNNKDDSKPSLAAEILDLTVKRKAGEGPGVTPGKVRLLSSDKSLADVAASLGVDVEFSVKSESVDAVVAKANAMTEGDVLVVGPISSHGVASDGKIVAETATGLGTFVGGKTGRGIVSVLMDGPREGLQLSESGYPISELLWYRF
jgi:hypothetical protein